MPIDPSLQREAQNRTRPFMVLFVALLAAAATFAVSTPPADARAPELDKATSNRSSVSFGDTSGGFLSADCFEIATFEVVSLREGETDRAPSNNKRLSIPDVGVFDPVSPDCDPPPPPPIDNGDPVDPAPGWMASLDSGCAGALIAPTWVLTAGHCLPGLTQVRLGATDWDSGGETRNVIDTRVHPWWLDNGGAEPFDVALLQLNSPASAVPISLAPPEDPVTAPDPNITNVTVYGYSSASGLDILRSSSSIFNTTHFLSNEVTGVVDFTINNAQICEGDSGGPGVTDSGALRSVTSYILGANTAGVDCDSGGFATDVSERHVRDWINLHVYDTTRQSQWDQLLYAGEDPEGVVAVQYPPLPFYASGAGTGLLGDIMAWKQFKTGIAPTSSWWAGDSPTITGCVDDGNGLDAAERANFVEANEFPTDPDGDWYCANAGFSAKDLILGSAYVQRKFETPVVVEQGPGQAFVIRRIDFDITGTDNADDTLRDLCGWTQSLSVNDAIAGCGAAYGDITPIMIIGRDMVTNQTRRLTLAEFDAEFHFSNELIFDPPAAAQFELVHAEVQ